MKGKKKIEIFRRSKKTIRSPVKMGEKERMREETREGLRGIKKEIRKVAR